MFFLTEYLLSIDNKKLPENTQDTHKTIYLAFLYYYFFKGSELEQNPKANPTTSRMSKALVLFKEVQDEAIELARIEKNASSLNELRNKRNMLTYKSNRSAEIKEAKNSINKAIEFRNLIEEYIISKKR